GLVSIVGGKLTTYRSLAEEAVDLVLQRLGRRSRGSRTAEIPLPGGSAGPFEGFAATFKATSGLDEATAERLLRIYGVRATAVVAIAEGDDALGAPLEGAPGSLAAEVVHAVRHEGAQTLADVLLRRTMVGLGPTAGIGPDRAAARVAQSHLRWDETRAAREVEDFRRYMRRYRPRGLAEA
ncbi:MAG: glycerol-3-phosphate dehydrogenase C-terminal domain-containing protein, partial [Solirubrobacteraceae bacterium]